MAAFSAQPYPRLSNAAAGVSLSLASLALQMGQPPVGPLTAVSARKGDLSAGFKGNIGFLSAGRKYHRLKNIATLSLPSLRLRKVKAFSSSSLGFFKLLFLYLQNCAIHRLLDF
jgi:hypothetical protein